MARRSSGYGYNMYDDIYEKMTNGIQTGFGIANAIKQNKVYDEQLKDIETQRAEWDKNAGVRDAERTEKMSSAEKNTTANRITTSQLNAGAISNTVQGILEADMPLPDAVKRFSETMGRITDGKLKVEYQPVDQANPNAGMRVSLFDKDKEMFSFNAANTKEFGGAITALRHTAGLKTIEEVDVEKRKIAFAQRKKELFDGLDPKITGGAKYEDFVKDPRKNATLNDMALMAEGKTTADYTDARQDQVNDNAQVQSVLRSQELSRAATSQQMGIAADNHAYNVNYTRPTQKQLNDLAITAQQHAANGNAAQEIETVDKMLPTLIPSLQPVLISGGSNEMDELGVMSNTKPVYGFTPEQQTYKAALLSIYNTLPKNTPVADKIAYADKVVRERNLQRQLEMEQRQADLENADEQAAKQRKAHEQLGKLNKKASPGWGVNPPRKDDENYDPYFYPHSSYLMP